MSTRTQLANAIRALSMDAVQKAASGHPGAPMGMADIAEVLWNDYLKHNPKNPGWADRDRFIMSNGHGSMLVYSLLHLTGYDLPMEELRNFRQLHSKTPGHPELGYTPGVETTTGPLGQGFANGVGMALAEKNLAAQFNREGHEIVDHYTYVFMGDGCIMEGISHEAASLAGHHGLGKLIAFYDDNGISIDGEVQGWLSDDTPKRFEAYGWHVIPALDGHDSQAVSAAIEKARAQTDKPTLICCKTVIGFGSPNKRGTKGIHGAPLGEEEVALARKELGWDYEPFDIPDDIYNGWNAEEKGQALESSWADRFAAYQKAHPELAQEFERRVIKGELPAQFSAQAEAFIKEQQEKAEKLPSRKASLQTIEAYSATLPELLGGSADLTGSNLTQWGDAQPISKENPGGNYIFYGVREFGMSAIMSGINAHGGFVCYGGTFLMFMDYARNAVRMAALMKLRNIFVYTHDSIGQGEDGPTHQPVEHMATLRATPNMEVWRPCDGAEVATAWKAAVERRDGPSALVFSRQGLEPVERDPSQLADIARGGYVLRDCGGQPELILIATGSEVVPTLEAAERLKQKGRKVRVVSMPSSSTFDRQDAQYREAVLPRAVTARVAVEAAHVDQWRKYVGLDGAVVGLHTFGESGKGGDLMDYFGFTADNIAKTAEGVL